MHRKVVVSSVGTSILSKFAIGPAERDLLDAKANEKYDAYNEEEIEILARIEKSAEEGLLKNPRGYSAELNGIYGFYDSDFSMSSDDMHLLIATDTFQGEITCRILEKYLIKAGFLNTRSIKPEKFSTKNKSLFLAGIKDLLRQCDQLLPAYKESHYQIIFNLTGGFKAMQGYLNTIGMFYADKIVYIFEKSEELIEIPRLPIRLDFSLFADKASLFLQLYHDRFFERGELEGIPDIYLEAAGENHFGLSAWGALTWNQVKADILKKELSELPFIHYENSFKDDVKKIERTDDRIQLIEKIALASVCLQNENGDIAALKGGRAGGILYDNYTGKNKHLGHFRINLSLRVTCEYRANKLHLRHYGTHDYTEKNP